VSPCLIRFTDDEDPKEVAGTTFKYVGNPTDVSEGDFDLDIWLKRMGKGGMMEGKRCET